MPDNAANMTPGGWLQFLEARLDDQCDAICQPQQYFDGEHKLAFATAKFREAFSRFFPPLANNWMKLVVTAPVSRLHVQGFRFDPDPTRPSWELDADQDAWQMWQANNLDSRSVLIHTEAVKVGVTYALVSPPKNPNSSKARDKMPRITAESADQCVVYSDPADSQTRLAGLKRWVDDFDNHAYATLYLPDRLYRWRSTEVYNPDSQKRIQWGGVLSIDSNPIGVVPLIPLENNPDLKNGGRSDLEEAIPIQDAVNKYCLDMQVSSEFHAFPQRYATGWERGEDDQGRELTNRMVELAAGQSRLWRAESPDTQFGQLSPGDVNNYILPIELYIDHLAAVTQTPAYYLKGKMANLSADALHAADAGLIDRCNRKILGFSDGWEEVMRTAFLAKGDPKSQERGNALSAETIWGDPETKTIGQLVDAAVKMRQVLSVPLEMCWELMGWSPEKIRQAKNMMNLPNTPADARPTPPLLGPDGNPMVPGPQAGPGVPQTLPAPAPPMQGQGQLASIPRSA